MYPLEIRKDVDSLPEETIADSIQSSESKENSDRSDRNESLDSDRQRRSRLAAVGAREKIRDIMTEDQDD